MFWSVCCLQGSAAGALSCSHNIVVAVGITLNRNLCTAQGCHSALLHFNCGNYDKDHEGKSCSKLNISRAKSLPVLP